MFIELYTKEGCPACERAKSVLKNFNFEYVEYVVGKDITVPEVKHKFPEAKTVPIIIVDGDQFSSTSELTLLLEKMQ